MVMLKIISIELLNVSTVNPLKHGFAPCGFDSMHENIYDQLFVKCGKFYYSLQSV